MRKYITTLLVLAIMLSLTGCESWLTGSYSSVTPHEEYHNSQSRDSLEASGAAELQEVLTQQVVNGQENCVIYVTDIEPDHMAVTMDAVIRKIKSHDPIGAFAVKQITYDVGTSTGRTAIAVKIAYNRSRSEILRIKKVLDMEAAFSAITGALDECQPGIVVLVDQYQEWDIVQKIQDFVDTHPDICMEMPQVSQSVYPQTGDIRVIELTFSYQNSREVLRQMQAYVQPVFRAATLNVSAEEDESVRYERMYAFLMERVDYQIETSITPAYSLLRHGVGDSKAFATVYAAMCNSAGLECYVISGTRMGDPWFWNMISLNGVYYHIDLLQSNMAGKLTLLYDEDMEGYVWDYSAYPASQAPEITDDTLTLAEVTEPVVPDRETTAPDAGTEESTVPDEFNQTNP